MLPAMPAEIKEEKSNSVFCIKIPDNAKVTCNTGAVSQTVAPGFSLMGHQARIKGIYTESMECFINMTFEKPICINERF